MNVAHYFWSGVAWVPWRIQEILKDTEDITVKLFGRAADVQCNYGLPRTASNLNDPRGLPSGCDIIHLHHDMMAQKCIEQLRSSHPKARIVVSVHGEPDRTRGKRGQLTPIVQPDAYHVVSSDLLNWFGELAPIVEFIPNHPGREFVPPAADDDQLTPRYGLDSEKQQKLFIPYSQVWQYKNPAQRDLVAAGLMGHKWNVFTDNSQQTNDDVLRALFTYDAAWVQLQGYAPDILTMECWSTGCIPIVLAPPEKDLRILKKFFGCAPPFSFYGADPNGIVEILTDENARRDVTKTVDLGTEFMGTIWTMHEAAKRWKDFYERVMEI